MICRFCGTETHITFAQHLLHTYLRRFHDLYECTECHTYRLDRKLIWLIRIGVILLSSYAVGMCEWYILMYYTGLQYQDLIGGAGTVFLVVIVILFEFVVYKLSNRTLPKAMHQDPITIPYTWEKPGFIKNLLHNLLGRYDYLFVDYEQNIYYRENHWVSFFRIALPFIVQFQVDLCAFIVPLQAPYQAYVSILINGFAFVFTIGMEYVFYTCIPYKQQRLTQVYVNDKNPSPVPR